MSSFAPATRKATYSRTALAGPAGSGKTWTALMLAHVLGDRIAVIDTERRSASKYVGVNGWQFTTSTPASFAPLALAKLVAEAADDGADVLIVDSWSHYWFGADGMLDQVDRRSKGGGSSFSSGWKEMRPEERAMVDALLSFPGHVIVTLRVKTEYVVETNDRGKSEPKKVGMKPEQRDGIEYEFDVFGDLDLSNTLTITKSRVPGLHREPIPEPGVEFAELIRAWCSEGDPVVDARELRQQVMDPAATASDIVAVGAQMAAAGLDNAAVLGPDGTAMRLVELVRIRHTEALAHPPTVTAVDPGTDPGDGGQPLQ